MLLVEALLLSKTGSHFHEARLNLSGSGDWGCRSAGQSAGSHDRTTFRTVVDSCLWAETLVIVGHKSAGRLSVSEDS